MGARRDEVTAFAKPGYPQASFGDLKAMDARAKGDWRSMAWPWPISGLGLVNAAAIGRHVTVTRDIRFADGRRGLLDVYAPALVDPRGRRSHDAPMVIFFYGGGWEAGAKADYRFAAMALAKRGIVTIVADYRLYPDVRFPDFIADGAKAVRWGRRNAAEFGADAGLIFLVGHSAGAYIATMLALDKTKLDAESLAVLTTSCRCAATC